MTIHYTETMLEQTCIFTLELLRKKMLQFTQTKISERNAKAEVLRKYASCLAEQNRTINEFDGSLWSGLVDYVTVYSKADIRVTFKDGTEITV